MIHCEGCDRITGVEACPTGHVRRIDCPDAKGAFAAPLAKPWREQFVLLENAERLPTRIESRTWFRANKACAAEEKAEDSEAWLCIASLSLTCRQSRHEVCRTFPKIITVQREIAGARQVEKRAIRYNPERSSLHLYKPLAFTKTMYQCRMVPGSSEYRALTQAVQQVPFERVDPRTLRALRKDGFSATFESFRHYKCRDTGYLGMNRLERFKDRNQIFQTLMLAVSIESLRILPAEPHGPVMTISEHAILETGEEGRVMVRLRDYQPPGLRSMFGFLAAIRQMKYRFCAEAWSRCFEHTVVPLSMKPIPTIVCDVPVAWELLNAEGRDRRAQERSRAEAAAASSF